MAFIEDCRSGTGVTRPRAKELMLNILCMKEIPVGDRTKIAMAALKEWQPETAEEELANFIEEFRLQIAERPVAS